ncbi:hypothetical protein AVEN_171229-1, partial [Araneus ventricosus]
MRHSFSRKAPGGDEGCTVLTFKGHGTVALRSRKKIVLHQPNLDTP